MTVQRHIVANQLKARARQERLDVLARSCKEVVEAHHLVSVGEKLAAEMRASKITISP